MNHCITAKRWMKMSFIWHLLLQLVISTRTDKANMEYSGLCLMCHINTDRIRMLVYVITRIVCRRFWGRSTFRSQHLRREIIVVVVTDSNDFFSVPYYTVISFETSHSWLVGMLKARTVVKLYGETGELQGIELKRYLCFILNNLIEMHLYCYT